MPDSPMDSMATGYQVENRITGTFEYWQVAPTATGYEVERSVAIDAEPLGRKPFPTEGEARAYMEKVVADLERHPDRYEVNTFDIRIPHNTVVNFDLTEHPVPSIAPKPTLEPHADQRAEAPQDMRPPAEPKPEDRATGAEGKSVEGFKTAAGRIADRFDQQVDQAARATATLKHELEDYVDEGGDPYAAAAGATLLDAAGLAMGVAQGFLDTLRLGEGVSKGTLAGAKEDVDRLLNVLPESKVVRAVSAASMAWDVAKMVEEAATTNDPKKAAQAAATIALTGVALAGKGKKKATKTAVLNEAKDVYKTEFKKAFARSEHVDKYIRAREASAEAHKKVQKHLERTFGKGVVDNERPLPVTQANKKGNFSWAAKSDSFIDIGEEGFLAVEFKSGAHVRNAKLWVGGSAYEEKQLAQSIGYESLAFTKGHSVFVINARGDVFEFQPDLTSAVTDDLLPGSWQKWPGN